MARIYLSGAESVELLRTLLENDSNDVLLSFFYVQKRGALPHILKLLKRYPNVKVFMDSGAKSFAKIDRGDPQTYWRAYYEFLKQHGHRFEYASEFDIDGYAWNFKGGYRTVSHDQIEAWRDDMHELEAVPIVPVWHPERGVEAWDALVKDSRFPHLAIAEDAVISTGGDARISKGGDARISRGEVGKLVARAHSWNKTVHGYAATLTDLPITHYDTVASSTWLVGQKFGDICIFQGGNYQRIYASSKEGKKSRKKFRKYFERIGVDPDKIEQDDRTEINRANIIAWNTMSQRMQLANPHKGPQRPTVAPQSTNAPAPEVIKQTLKTIPLQPVESVTVEKTEESPIVLQEIKPFMPSGAPGMMCATCAMATDCPKYQENAVCAFQAEFSKVGTRDANQVVEELAAIFSVNVERARYLRLWEQINGGIVQPEVTKHMEQTFQMGAKLAELQKGKKSTRSTVQGEGVLSRFFGGLGGEQKVLVAGEQTHELPEDYENEDEEKIVEDSRTARQRKQMEN